VPIEEEEEVH